jgi:hypothetical protein
MKGEVLPQKTSLTRHFLLKCLYQSRKMSARVHLYLCFSGIDFASFYDFPLEFGTISTV